MTLKNLISGATVITAASLALSLTGCATAAAEQENAPSIVVTTSVFGDIVSQIAGDDAQVTVLIPAGSDPHEYQPSSRDINLLHTADLVIAVGAGFEESLETQLAAAQSDGVNIVKLADSVDTRENSDLYGDGSDTHAAHDHSDHDHTEDGHDDSHDHEGHEHGPIDPHFWHDPTLVSQAVHVIEDEVSELAGVDQAAMKHRAEEYQEELTALDDELATQFAEIPEASRMLITQHNVLGYLAQRYHFTIVGAIIPSTSTLAQSSAAQLNVLVKEINATGASAVFTDVTQSDALAQTIAAELADGSTISIVALYTESLSEAGGEATTYIDMMRVNAERITEGLVGDAQ